MDSYIDEVEKASAPILPALNRLKDPSMMVGLNMVVAKCYEAAGIAEELRMAIYHGKQAKYNPIWDMFNKRRTEQIKRVREEKTAELLQAALGMVEQSVGFLEEVHDYIQSGKRLDDVMLIEKAGDQMYYIAKAAKWLGVNFPIIMALNAEKIKEANKNDDHNFGHNRE